MKFFQRTILVEKIKESLSSVLPVTAIVFLLLITVAPVSASILISFIIGTLLLIVGMGFFTLGAEVYLSSTLFNTVDLSSLCYKGTDLMLVEPKYEKNFSKETKIRLRRLITDYGITPVIAHIDRYPFLMSDEKLLSELKEEGCMFQANLSSFSSYFSRKKLINFYRKGYLDFLGEDIHHKALLKSEREKILEKISKKEDELLFSMDEKAKALLFSLDQTVGIQTTF